MSLVRKGLLGLGAVTLAAAPLALSAATSVTQAGAQAVEPIVVNFDEVGASDFTVPDDVHCLGYEVIGAAGGTGNGATPGLGGRVAGVIEVLPGQTLQVNVGGAGGNSPGEGVGGVGGFNGGGAGGTATGTGDGDEGGGGGGGATDIRQGGTTLADRVAVGAGGGGTGSFGGSPPNGGDGGSPGVDGGDGDGGFGGAGGTASGGGAGGASITDSPIADGEAGSLGQGGTGGGGAVSNIDAGAGGGGGGYYGGGGGGGADSGLPGAGGGGSNFSQNGGSSSTGVESGNGADGHAGLSYVAGDTSCVAAPLTIVKQVAGSPLPAAGTQFTIRVQCAQQSIDLGSIGQAGIASAVDLAYTVDGSGVAQPAAGHTISFIAGNECEVIETDAGGAASTTYACSGSGAIADNSVSAESWGVSDTAVVTPGDPCVAAGPQTDPLAVNIISPDQEATVVVQNSFAAAAAAVTPRFTG